MPTEPSSQPELPILIIVFFSSGIRFGSFSTILCSMLAVYAFWAVLPLHFPRVLGRWLPQGPPALILHWLKSVCGEHLRETGKRRTVQFGYAVPNCPLSVHPAWLGLSLSGCLCSQEVTLCVRSTSPPSAPSSLGKEEYASTASLMVPVLGVPGGYYTFLHTVKVPFGDTPPYASVCPQLLARILHYFYRIFRHRVLSSRPQE